VLNFCANNYLGLSAHPEVIAAAHAAIDTHGFGLSSVRFICGTQDIHKTLERRSAASSAPRTRSSTRLLRRQRRPVRDHPGEEDAIISDALNHASIIDGIRLSKAERHRYPNGDMAELEQHLKATQDSRTR
jgi:glycine C-acetyltransferase